MEYVSQVFASEDLVFQDPAGPRYNIPPGTRPLALHRLGGAVDLDRQYWSWRPQGSKYRMNCARLDKVLAGSWPWKQLINRGRIVVPADGWYEWKQLEQAGKPGKQPFYIHRVDEGPLFFAGLSNWRAGAQRDEAHGFAIVTNDAAGGMVDVHDRRPVALPPSVAKQWLDPETSVGQALELLQHGLAETLFKWHAVKQAVGNSRYELPDAIHPI